MRSIGSLSWRTVNESRRGFVYGVVAYGFWGVVPVFWKQLANVDPVEQLAHRAVWGLVVLVAIAGLSGHWPAVREGARDRKTLAAMALSGALLALNWGLFVFAVATDHLLDASLGYFMNPLVSVALGTLVLRERLGRLQWLAIGLAVVGVATMTWYAGRLPWIAVVLAFSFGLYGLVRKTARVDSLAGATIETALMAPIAIAFLVRAALAGDGALGHADVATHILLVATGIVTAGPLLLFTGAARRLPLATIGFLQYLAPSGQFLLAVLVYDEPFASAKLAAFTCIWLALAVFSIDAWRRFRAARPGEIPGLRK
jgi:chloramphenicol-sensitive protein RarD